MTQHHFRENEIWLPSVPMSAGFYSDTGYRFRENIFLMHDSWVPGVSSEQTHFYEVTTFNSDPLKVHTDHKVVAKMFFRIDVDKVIHTRKVFKFMDWLGAIGGIEKLLLKFTIVLLGGFA